MPKIIDKLEQRQKIAAAAITVIADVGLDQTRLRDVARAGNITTGAVTHYFDGKEELLEAALEEVVKRTQAQIQQGLSLSNSGNIANFTKSVCRFLPSDEDASQEWRVWLAFWGRAIADERLRAIHQDYYQAFVEHLIQSLSELSPAESKKSKAELHLFADAVIAAIDGVGLRATLDQKAWPKKRQQETLEALLIPLLSSL